MSVMIPSPTYNFTTPVVATYVQAGDRVATYVHPSFVATALERSLPRTGSTNSEKYYYYDVEAIV